MGTRRGTRGSEAIEFAIVLPVLLMMMLGIMDLGRLIWSYTTLARSVEAAARCAAINTTVCGSSAATASYAVTQAWGLPITASAYTVTIATCGTQVNGTLNFVFLIPWFYGTAPFGAANTLALNAMACYSG